VGLVRLITPPVVTEEALREEGADITGAQVPAADGEIPSARHAADDALEVDVVAVEADRRQAPPNG